MYNVCIKKTAELGFNVAFFYKCLYFLVFGRLLGYYKKKRISIKYAEFPLYFHSKLTSVF